MIDNMHPLNLVVVVKANTVRRCWRNVSPLFSAEGWSFLIDYRSLYTNFGGNVGE